MTNLTIGIKGFKSIVDTEFELGQINVLIGANGSGKSALLEAIGMLSAAISGTVANETLSCRGVRLGTPQRYKSAIKDLQIPNISLSIRWQNDQDTWNYSVKLTEEEQSLDSSWYYQEESLKLNDQLFCDREEKVVKEISRGSEHNPSQPLSKTSNGTGDLGISTLQSIVGPTVGLGNLILRGKAKHIPSATLFREALSSYAIYAPTTPALRDLTNEARPSHLSFPVGLSGSHLAEAVEDLINHEHEEEKFGDLDLDDVLDLLDWYRNITVGPANSQILSPNVPRLPKSILFQDRFLSASNNVLSAYDANEGSLYVLLFLTLATHPKAPRMFAIDNFDQALNPRLVRATAKLFSKTILANPHSPIVLLTTHHPLVLDGLDFSDERIRLFAVERDRQGYTTVRRVTITQELLNEGKKGLTLSRLWVMGYLGGMPNL